MQENSVQYSFNSFKFKSDSFLPFLQWQINKKVSYTQILHCLYKSYMCNSLPELLPIPTLYIWDSSLFGATQNMTQSLPTTSHNTFPISSQISPLHSR